MSESDQRPVLDYARPDAGGVWTTVHQFANEWEAHLFAQELWFFGIKANVLTGSTRYTVGFDAALAKIDLQVMPADVERAKKLLIERLDPTSVTRLEPAEADDPLAPKTVEDEVGPVETLAVGAYETVPALREAALVLESAGVRTFMPKLVSRGDAEPGVGARFVLRVGEDDLARAKGLLAPPLERGSSRSSSPDDGHATEPRCPKCGSWNVYEMTHELKNLILSLVGRARPQQCECLKCHYVDLREAFMQRRTSA